MLLGFDASCIGYPGKYQTMNDFFVAQSAVEPLGRYSGDGVLQPFLAEKFESDFNTKTATVTLKKNINFQDGTPLNADAVIWNWNEYTSAGKTELNAVDKYEKVDDYTVKVYLKQWDNAIIDNLCYFGGYMVSPASVQKNGKDWAILNPVGTGPYKLKSWEQGVKVVFEKNDTYWGGSPFLDGVEFDVIKDNTTKVTAFRTKEADILIDPGDYNVADQLKKEGFNLTSRVTGMGASITGFMPSSADPKSPFYKLEVRQAFMYAVDTKAISQNLTLGNGLVTNQWAPPTAWSYNKDVVGYPYNPEKAKELLASAGYPNGFDTTIFTSNTQGDIQRATILQGYLKAVGINAKIDAMEQAKYDQLSGKDGHWDGIAWWASRGDPDISLTYPRVLSKNASRFPNGTPHLQEMEDIMAQAKAAPTMEEKTKICQEMSKMVIDKYAYILPIDINSSPIFAQKNVSDTNFGYNYWSSWTPETAKKSN